MTRVTSEQSAGTDHQFAPIHVEFLEAHGVLPNFAWANGVRSEDAATVALALGLSRPAHSGGLAFHFPHRRKQSPYVWVRYDERAPDGVCFGTPAGTEDPIYIASAAVFDVNRPLVATEDPIKALAFACLGHASVGLRGRLGTLVTTADVGVLGDGWRGVPLRRRKTFVMFDASTSRSVAEAEVCLGRMLAAAGAEVTFLRIPPRRVDRSAAELGGLR